MDKLKNICRSHSQPALGGSAVRERSSSAAGGGGHHGGSAPSLSQKNFKVGPTIILSGGTKAWNEGYPKVPEDL